MKKQPQTEQQALLELLRQKQARQGVSYATTASPAYKTFHLINLLALLCCTVINLLYFLGTFFDLTTKLSNKTTVVNDIQAGQISAIKNSLIAVGIMGLVQLSTALFAKLKLPLARLIAGLVSSLALLATYYTRLSGNINAGDYSTLLWRHLLPTAVFVASLLVACIIAIRQKHYDTAGCREIAESIYRRYSISAQSISDEQWQQLLNSTAAAPKPRGKKRNKQAAEPTQAVLKPAQTNKAKNAQTGAGQTQNPGQAQAGSTPAEKPDETTKPAKPE